MNVRRMLVGATAVPIAGAALLVPVGAGAELSSSRATPPATWTLNGTNRRPPVYVRCAAGATRGTPLPVNTINTRVRHGVRGIRMRVTFLDDRSAPIVIMGRGRAALPARLRLPCSGVGFVRYRIEQVARVRVRVRSHAFAIPGRGIHQLAAGATRTITHTVIRVLERSTEPVVFVGQSS